MYRIPVSFATKCMHNFSPHLSYVPALAALPVVVRRTLQSHSTADICAQQSSVNSSPTSVSGVDRTSLDSTTSETGAHSSVSV